MIAHIIPIKRMPRTLGFLSYAVPTALEGRLLPGQLVRIPLRKSMVYGLVFSIDPTPATEEMKPIDALVAETPLLSEEHISFLCTIADTYGISYGTAALLCTPPLQPRKLDKEQWHALSPTVQTTPPTHTLALYTTPETLADHLRAVTPHTLILVPELADIATILALLPPDLTVLTWHGGLSTKEQYARWFTIRSGACDVIVSTRAAIGLPFAELAHIVVYREEDTAHKNWGQKPYYLVHDVLPLLAHRYQASCTYLTTSPRFETYYAAAKGTLRTDATTFPLLHAPIEQLQCLDMRNERKAGNMDLLAERIQEHITHATGDVVLYINRKGYATAVGCTTCEFVSRCARCGMAHILYASTNTLRCHYCGTSERLPSHCPSCHQATIQPFGIGAEQVEAYIRTHGTNLPHAIVRIDSSMDTVPELPTDRPVILIGTDKMLPHVRWDRTEHCTLVQVDDQLLYPDFRAVESVWHTIRHIAYHLPPTAQWFVQTMQPHHLLFRSLSEPERLYRTDLHARQGFHMPPYGVLVRLTVGKPTEYGAKTEAQRVYQLLSRTITEHGIAASLRTPYPTSPTFYRGMQWYALLLILDPVSWHTDIQRIIALLPGNWQVDVSPGSLLGV